MANRFQINAYPNGEADWQFFDDSGAEVFRSPGGFYPDADAAAKAVFALVVACSGIDPKIPQWSWLDAEIEQVDKPPQAVVNALTELHNQGISQWDELLGIHHRRGDGS